LSGMFDSEMRLAVFDCTGNAAACFRFNQCRKYADDDFPDRDGWNGIYEVSKKFHIVWMTDRKDPSVFSLDNIKVSSIGIPEYF